MKTSGDIGHTFRDLGNTIYVVVVFQLRLLLISEVFFDGNTRKEVEGRTIDGYSLFKKGIRPEWEDIANRNGSEYTCRKTMTVELVDFFWENLVFALIGEMIDENDEICGCRVVDKSKKGNNRTTFRLELWLRSSNQEIGERIKARMLEALVEGDGGKSVKAKYPEFEYKKRTP